MSQKKRYQISQRYASDLRTKCNQSVFATLMHAYPFTNFHSILTRSLYTDSKCKFFSISYRLRKVASTPTTVYFLSAFQYSYNGNTNLKDEIRFILHRTYIHEKEDSWQWYCLLIYISHIKF